MHPSLQRTWDVADVEQDLRDALDLVERLDPPVELVQSTYAFAVQCLTQRAQRVAAGGLVLPQPPAG